MDRGILSLLQSCPTPRLASLAKGLSMNPERLLLKQPIQVFSSPLHGLGLRASCLIPAESPIMLLSTQSCFTNLELLGSTPVMQTEVEQMAQHIADKYHAKGSSQYHYTIKMIKVLVQIFAHQKMKEMSMHEYSAYLYDEVDLQHLPIYWPKPLKQQIFSAYLNTIVVSTEVYLESVLADMKQGRFYGLQQEEFIKLVSLVRSRQQSMTPQDPSHNSTSFLIQAPLFDIINHQFINKCNARLGGQWDEVRSDSYLTLTSTKDIMPGEEITVSYGEMNNHELLAKYGFIMKDNPYSQMKVGLDFDQGEYQQYASDQFLLKQRILASNKDSINLESVVLFKDKINNEIITLLRIYFISSEDLQQNIKINSYLWNDFSKQISTNNEQLVFKFLKDILQQQLDNYELLKQKRYRGDIAVDNEQQIAGLKDQNLKNMLSIIMEEKTILKNNLVFIENRLQTLYQ